MLNNKRELSPNRVSNDDFDVLKERFSIFCLFSGRRDSSTHKIEFMIAYIPKTIIFVEIKSEI